MSSKITVVITTWQVPFDQTVNGVFEFEDVVSATAAINAASLKWWHENDGDRAVADNGDSPYEPINELGYDFARIELWGGENGFHAMLDSDSAARLLEQHYKREYDDKGITRPGYMRAAMGEDVSADIAELEAFYNKPKH